VLSLLTLDWSRRAPFRLRSCDSFAAAPGGTESDVRFLYTACVISYLLNDWDGVDREKAIAFIRSSQVGAGAKIG